MGRIKQVAFDLDAPLFSATELAIVSGMSREAVNLWVSRKLLEPTRRERPLSRRGRKTKEGRPRFSAKAIFRTRLARELGTHLGIGLSEWIALAGAAEVSELASGGVWMEAVARSVENNTRLAPIYAYAAYDKGKREWLFDMKIGQLEEPEEFGLDIPHIFIPMSEVFKAVYIACKKLLGM